MLFLLGLSIPFIFVAGFIIAKITTPEPTPMYLRVFRERGKIQYIYTDRKNYSSFFKLHHLKEND